MGLVSQSFFLHFLDLAILDLTMADIILEIPDLSCPKNLEYLRSWTGVLRFIPNITIKRFRKPVQTKADPCHENGDEMEENETDDANAKDME